MVANERYDDGASSVVLFSEVPSPPDYPLEAVSIQTPSGDMATAYIFATNDPDDRQSLRDAAVESLHEKHYVPLFVERASRQYFTEAWQRMETEQHRARRAFNQQMQSVWAFTARCNLPLSYAIDGRTLRRCYGAQIDNVYIREVR